MYKKKHFQATKQVESGERIAKLIRNAEKAKTPVMLVVGAKEAEEQTVAARLYQVRCSSCKGKILKKNFTPILKLD